VIGCWPRNLAFPENGRASTPMQEAPIASAASAEVGAQEEASALELAREGLGKFFRYSGFGNARPGHLIMIGWAFFSSSWPSATTMNPSC
jgi:hypothetical protein